MFPLWSGRWPRIMLHWSDFWLETFVHMQSHRHHLSPCLRADGWPIDDVYRLLIKGLARMHDEKQLNEGCFYR